MAFDAVLITAAHLVGADVFSSADRRLCAAASSDGFHIANPIDGVASVPGPEPTTPPPTVAVIIGNFDGKPGNKRDLKRYLTHTPDEDIPRRSRQLNWAQTPD